MFLASLPESFYAKADTNGSMPFLPSSESQFNLQIYKACKTVSHGPNSEQCLDVPDNQSLILKDSSFYDGILNFMENVW